MPSLFEKKRRRIKGKDHMQHTIHKSGDMGRGHRSYAAYNTQKGPLSCELQKELPSLGGV